MECVEVMYDVIEETNHFRRDNNMEIKNIERKNLKNTFDKRNPL